MKKKKVLLISCSVIMLCICIVAGMSYALFTDSITVSNHLRAGNLKVGLTRTNLEYSVLNANGELETKTVSNSVDLTSSTGNAFGIDKTNTRIVPGSYFQTDLQIENNGNTAFTYGVTIRLNSTSNKLAEQMKVMLLDAEGHVVESKTFSELGANGWTLNSGRVLAGETAEKFTVRVEFVDNGNNNAAMNLTADFDLVVTATQATA